MSRHAKRSPFFLLLVLLILAVGCQPVPAPALPTATQAPVPEAVATMVVATIVDVTDSATPEAGATEPAAPEEAPTQTAQPEPAATEPALSDPLANCPAEEAGKHLYVSEVNGFCFVYPDGFIIQPDELRPDEVVKLVGPREEPKPKQMEYASVVVWVASNGPADVASSADYAQKWRELYISPMDPAEISQENAEIGGYPAVVLDGLPGMILQRAGFVVANGHKYSLTISPMPGFVTELDEPVRQAWEMVTGSIHFFPPLIPRETTLASQVCPQPAAGTKLLVRESEGYCFLYPEDFVINQDFGGRVEGGPNLGNWEGFENVRVSLTLGSYPMLAAELAQTPREHASRINDIDPNSIQDRTIGGAQAVVFKVDPPGGPWAARQAYILTNQGRVYTIVNDPWEPERWPDSTEPFERVWETVTGSLTFFTPWQ